MEVKVKKLSPEAVVPKYANPGDAGLDLVAIDNGVHMISHGGDKPVGYYRYKTGLAFQIPKGHVGLIFPRSSISNTGLFLTNAVGVLDSGYRGEIEFRFKAAQDNPSVYKKGDKIGQLVIMPFPEINLVEVELLDGSARGEGGFGSSGR